jgi:hypothetical protein
VFLSTINKLNARVGELGAFVRNREVSELSRFAW